MMSQIPQEIDKYEIQGSLGSGHFSDVYRAFDRALQVPRAIKVIHVRDPQRFMSKLLEARLLEVCRHKHVVEVKEANIFPVNGDQCVVIATELLQNGSVQDLLEREHLSLQDAVRIIRETCFGLEHLHTNGVLHCDIKPANILLSDTMVAKLSDFGLAVRIQLREVPAQFYNLHVSPEIIRGANPTIHSDVYSMGVTLYRLINNISDLQSLAPRNLPQAILSGRFPNRSGYRNYVPKKISRICNKSIHKDLNMRFQSPSELRQALERLSFGISWHSISGLHWVGTEGKHSYSLHGSSNRNGWKVDFLKNNRRVRDLCRSRLTNNWEAEKVIHSIIASTSLED